jgi:hypothetical protein
MNSQAFQSLTSSNPNGLTNASRFGTMGSSGVPDPTYSHIYSNDFSTYAAGDWTITLTGTGTAALIAGDGGILQLTTTTGTTDAVFVQQVQPTFTIDSGKQMFFKFAGSLADATLPAFYCGMLNQTTTPLAPTDGFYCYKTAGSTSLHFAVVVGSVSTSISTPIVLNLAAGVYFEIGFQIDQYGNFAIYWQPQTGTQLAPNPLVNPVAKGRIAQYTPAAFTTVNLSPSFGIQNSTAAAKTLNVDYIVASNER